KLWGVGGRRWRVSAGRGRCSPPPWTSAGERLSTQSDWPAAASLRSLDLAMVLHLPFHRLDLHEPLDVPLAAVELGREERGHELACDGRADDLGAEAEDVHVVVLDALVGAVDVVADRRPDPRELARGDRGADP